MKALRAPRRVALPRCATLPAASLAFALASAAGAPAHASGLTGDTSAAPRCEVGVELLGVVYNDRAPEDSFAMVSYGARGTRMVYVGSRIAGKRVGAILPMAIWLGPTDAPCWLPLSHDAPRAKVPARKPPKKRKKKRKKR
jgi:hypothetical protein